MILTRILSGDFFIDPVFILPQQIQEVYDPLHCSPGYHVKSFLTLTVLVTTIDALQHFETGL